jgi:hypothetical protein
MKSLVLVLLGVVGYHLYANASDREQLVYTLQSTVSSSAKFVADTTKPALVEQLKNR